MCVGRRVSLCLRRHVCTSVLAGLRASCRRVHYTAVVAMPGAVLPLAGAVGFKQMAAAVFRSRSSCGCSFRSRGDAVLVNCCSRYYHLPLLTAICSTSEWTGIAQSALKWAAEDALAYVC